MTAPVRSALPALFAGLMACTAFADVTVRDVENQVTAGSTVTLEEGQFVVRADDKEVGRRPPADVLEVQWDQPAATAAAAPAKVLVTLNSGDRIAGEITRNTPDGFEIAGPDFGVLPVSLAAVRRLTVQANVLEEPPTQFPEGHKEREDYLLLANGDSDDGRVESIGTDGVRFNSSLIGQERVLPLDQIVTVILYQLQKPPDTPKEGCVVTVTSSTGLSEVTGTLQALTSTGLEIKNAYGETLKMPLERAGSLFLRSTRCTYLSDLEPASYEFTDPMPRIASDGADDYQGPRWELARDHAVVTDRGILPIRMKANARVRVYRKGLGMHATSQVTYKLDGGAKRFLATAGLDESAEPVPPAEPSVVFRVVGDGKELFKSDVLRWKSAPVEVAVSIEGVRELRLEVDATEDYHCLDRADWASARIVR